MKVARFINVLALAVLSQSSLQALAKDMNLVCRFENQFNGKKEYALAIDAHSKDAGKYLNVPGKLSKVSKGKAEFLSGHSAALLEEYCQFTIRAHWKGAHSVFKLDGMKILADESSPLYSINNNQSADYPEFLTSGWEDSMNLPEKVLDKNPDSKLNKEINSAVRQTVLTGTVIAAVGGVVIYTASKYSEITKDPKDPDVIPKKDLLLAQAIENKGKAPKKAKKINSIFSLAFWEAVEKGIVSDAKPYKKVGKTAMLIWGFYKMAQKGSEMAGKYAGKFFISEKVDLAKKFEAEAVTTAI